jgi:hypothetical protein
MAEEIVHYLFSFSGVGEAQDPVDISLNISNVLADSGVVPLASRGYITKYAVKPDRLAFAAIWKMMTDDRKGKIEAIDPEFYNAIYFLLEVIGDGI